MRLVTRAARPARPYLAGMNATPAPPHRLAARRSFVCTRRPARARRLLVGVFLVASTIAAATPANAATAPVGFRGPERNGQFAGSLPRTRPAVVWTFATDGPVRSSPLLIDGALVFGSGDGYLYSVDAATGKERWRFTTGGPVDGSAAYVTP